MHVGATSFGERKLLTSLTAAVCMHVGATSFGERKLLTSLTTAVCMHVGATSFGEKKLTGTHPCMIHNLCIIDFIDKGGKGINNGPLKL
jgi:hypothetical protein